ncbi:TatD family hydrolase [Methylomonas sp. EFPC3]|uniref:TatD family hydrolase n=1 Tax=Methylomonas sp. EFPC3 TaxID=3021710 RepID=UPI002416306C|nr:TatD family hydrolase [Methylomonas sp. EFPC3]WFP50901.1 TatD family hydrolase [Methylomonas sp. EFPC3]
MPVSAPFIDIHSHGNRQDAAWQILSLDISEIAELPPLLSASNHQYFSIGTHPWNIDRQDQQRNWQIQHRLCNDPRVLAVGESGLDKCIDIPLERQTAVFQGQIELAEQIGKPLIVHCVRAYNELIPLKKSARPNQAWLVHGFTGKPALAEQLLRHGCYLSFGKYLLTPGHPSRKALLITPLERLFLETDASTQLSISEIYNEAAKILGLDIQTLQRRIVANFQRVFLHD